MSVTLADNLLPISQKDNTADSITHHNNRPMPLSSN
jgi:hypothetical protein